MCDFMSVKPMLRYIVRGIEEGGNYRKHSNSSFNWLIDWLVKFSERSELSSDFTIKHALG